MNEQPQTTALQKVQPEAELLPLTPAVASSFWLNRDKFEHIQRIAKVFAESNLVPAQYRGKIADCIIAAQMAFRLSVDPFMFMQNTYVVYGRPGMEAKLAIALVNERGPFDGPIQWRFSRTCNQCGGLGEKDNAPCTRCNGTGSVPAKIVPPAAMIPDDFTCTAFATHRKTNDICEARISWKMVKDEGWFKKDGSKWQTMPELMFRYRSATFLARLYAPECLMGMQMIDELQDVGVRTITIEKGAVTHDTSKSDPPEADPDAFKKPENNGGNGSTQDVQNEAANAPQGENTDAPNSTPTPEAQKPQDAAKPETVKRGRPAGKKQHDIERVVNVLKDHALFHDMNENALRELIRTQGAEAAAERLGIGAEEFAAMINEA
ncbi:hypothetical protein LLG95_05520 [bacterium]|nr:hypothetical protein [bacterium]